MSWFAQCSCQSFCVMVVVAPGKAVTLVLNRFIIVIPNPPNKSAADSLPPLSALRRSAEDAHVNSIRALLKECADKVK